MADRINALTVVLDADTRDEDAEPLIAAISQLRGVASVTPHVSQLEDHIAYTRARQDLTRRLYDALNDK